jgi:hypothetical protein
MPTNKTVPSSAFSFVEVDTMPDTLYRHHPSENTIGTRLRFKMRSLRLSVHGRGQCCRNNYLLQNQSDHCFHSTDPTSSPSTLSLSPPQQIKEAIFPCSNLTRLQQTNGPDMTHQSGKNGITKRNELIPCQSYFYNFKPSHQGDRLLSTQHTNQRRQIKLASTEKFTSIDSLKSCIDELYLTSTHPFTPNASSLCYQMTASENPFVLEPFVNANTQITLPLSVSNASMHEQVTTKTDKFNCNDSTISSTSTVSSISTDSMGRYHQIHVTPISIPPMLQSIEIHCHVQKTKNQNLEYQMCLV